MGGPGLVNPVSDYRCDKLSPWERAEKERQEKATSASHQWFSSMTMAKIAALERLDTSKPAYKLDRILTQDLDLLREFVSDPAQDIERRAKVLEVIILRGADNNCSYEDLKGMAEVARQPVMISPDGPPAMSTRDYEQYAAKLANQTAAMDLVLKGDPQLFHHLSTSRQQLPDDVSGRYPATEWMNMMLKEGGPLSRYEKNEGGDDARQAVFLPWVMNLPPEQRGEATFHLRDAGATKDLNDQRWGVKGVEVSSGIPHTPLTVNVVLGPGTNPHWDTVLRHAEGPIDKSVEGNPQASEAFLKGYQAAGRQM